MPNAERVVLSAEEQVPTHRKRDMLQLMLYFSLAFQDRALAEPYDFSALQQLTEQAPSLRLKSLRETGAISDEGRS